MTIHSYVPSHGHGLRHDPFNSIVAPRPIGWISTVGPNGIPNLAPYSFFNSFNYHPPIIGFASIGWKDSVRNIADTGVFGWNLATTALAEAMNQTSAPLDSGIDEFDYAGIKTRAADLIDVPLVAASPVSFECRMTQMVQLRTAAGDDIETWLTLGEVIKVHIDADCIKDGIYDTVAARPILRGGGPKDYFRIDESVKFAMQRPADKSP